MQMHFEFGQHGNYSFAHQRFDVTPQFGHVEALTLQIIEHAGHRALAAIVLRIRVHVRLAALIQRVVGQMHVDILYIFGVGLAVWNGAQSSQTFFANVNFQWINTNEHDVNAKIEFVVFQQERIFKVFLYDVVATRGDVILWISNEIDAFTLGSKVRFYYKRRSDRFLFAAVSRKLRQLMWQVPSQRIKVIFGWKQNSHGFKSAS